MYVIQTQLMKPDWHLPIQITSIMRKWECWDTGKNNVKRRNEYTRQNLCCLQFFIFTNVGMRFYEHERYDTSFLLF